MLTAILATLLVTSPPAAPAVAVLPIIRPDLIATERALAITGDVAAALAASGLLVPHPPQAALDRSKALACAAGDRECLKRLGEALGVVAVVRVEAAEVQGSVAVSLEAFSATTAQVVGDASFLIRADHPREQLVADLAAFVATVKAGLPAPAVVAPPGGPPPHGRLTPEPSPRGFLILLRADGEVVGGGLAPGLSAGYTLGWLAADLTLLLPMKVVGARLEVRLFPFDFRRVRPFVGAGLTTFFTRGWGSAEPAGAEAPFAFGPRLSGGAELPLGLFHLRADAAVEVFLVRNRPAEFHPVAVLLGLAAGIRL